MSLLQIGLTGINAAQSNLITTGHNATNASNEYYTRQEVNQATNVASHGAGGYHGNGTVVNSITRYYNEHLEAQLRDAHSRNEQLNAYYQQMVQIDNLLGGDDSTLTTVMSNFFSAIDAMSGKPDDLSLRQQALSVAQTMVSRFKSADNRLDELHDGLNSQISVAVEKINAHAENIAMLNRQIMMATRNRQDPNDLLDARNAQVGELAKLVNVEVFDNQNGTINVFVGQGHSLVMADNPYQLGTRLSSLSANIEIVAYDTSKTLVELSPETFTGGQLGGFLSARNDVDAAKNSIGAITVGLIQTFNEQHLKGVDLYGKDGQLFFKPVQPQTSADLNNKGNALVKASWTSISDLLAPGYRFERTNNGYQILDMANNVLDTFTALPKEFNGFVIQAQGAMEVGDGFTLNVDGVIADPDNNGVGNITVNVSNVKGSDYMLTRTLSGYSLLRMSDNSYIPVSRNFPEEPMVVDGMVISIDQGEMSEGDRFMIRPVHDVADMFEVNIKDPKEFAAGYAFRTEAATGNAGNGKIDQGTITALSPLSEHAPNLREKVTITFNDPPTSFSVTGVGTGDPTNVPFVSGGAISYNGWSVKISGTPKAGDQFVVSENAAGVSDNRNSLVLFGMQSEKLIEGGNQSYNSSYRTLVSAAGMKTMLAEETSIAEKAILNEKQTARDAVSGVSLEEEAANLVRYQQAYQAASKVIATATQIFEEILSAVR